MKVMSKADIIARNKVQRSLTEQEILQVADHPCIVKMYYSFQTAHYIYFVLDYCAGGEFFWILHNRPGNILPEEWVRFYGAEVLLALEYLHSLGYVYRDLKPENLLVHASGHIKLTDFDLSTPFAPPAPKRSVLSQIKHVLHGDSQAERGCQTQRVTSTVLLARQSTLHRKWLAALGTGAQWTGGAFGVLLYEMAFGVTPFKATFSNIVGSHKIRLPEEPHISHSCKALILGLLHRNPKKRLGFKHGGGDVKKMEFFEPVNWNTILISTPPHTPNLKGPEDTSRFKHLPSNVADPLLDLESPWATDSITERGYALGGRVRGRSAESRPNRTAPTRDRLGSGPQPSMEGARTDESLQLLSALQQMQKSCPTSPANLRTRTHSKPPLSPASSPSHSPPTDRGSDLAHTSSSELRSKRERDESLSPQDEAEAVLVPSEAFSKGDSVLPTPVASPTQESASPEEKSFHPAYFMAVGPTAIQPGTDFLLSLILMDSEQEATSTSSPARIKSWQTELGGCGPFVLPVHKSVSLSLSLPLAFVDTSAPPVPPPHFTPDEDPSRCLLHEIVFWTGHGSKVDFCLTAPLTPGVYLARAKMSVVGCDDHYMGVSINVGVELGAASAVSVAFSPFGPSTIIREESGPSADPALVSSEGSSHDNAVDAASEDAEVISLSRDTPPDPCGNDDSGRAPTSDKVSPMRDNTSPPSGTDDSDASTTSETARLIPDSLLLSNSENLVSAV
eukprot:CAMPEP_0114545378 /NCGR_PEP_ID=MMETSP0114-20121206/3367_1 /TAXON_ID=31324 /ORGANISM="Goniomonas sp, Strain m" /LENGTH=732 /DNA_ID=CAMNT_0001729799 /DNA_START=83 /DNA_END=2280 /DNA_ORIENTATION=+